MMVVVFVAVVMMTALPQRRACEIPSTMPATRLVLLRPFSLLLVLLLLLGPRLFVGSFSLGSAASSSPAERPAVAAAGPQAAATLQEGPAFLAASPALLPREGGSPQPSAASVSVWDRTTGRGGGGGGSDSPVVMTRQKDVYSPNTEAEISTSYIRGLDAASTSGNDKLRTLRTNLASASVAATGNSTSYTKITRSVNVTPQLSQMKQTKRASASQNMAGIAQYESVTRKTTNSSVWEKKYSAIGNNYHTANTWDEDSTTSSFHIPDIGSSATLSQNSERTSRFLRENFTGKGPATQKELATSSGQIQWSSHVTFPIPQSRTSNAKQPDSLTRIVLTQSSTSPQTNTHQRSRNSNTEKIISSSDMEYMTILNTSNRSEQKIFQTIKDFSSSQDPHSTSAISNLEMSTKGGKILQTLRASISQGPHSTSAVSNLEMSTNGWKILQTLREISSFQGPHSTSAISNLEMSTKGGMILQTLRDSNSQGPHSTPVVSNLEMSTHGGKILQTLREMSSSQGPHSTSAVSNLEMSTSGRKILRTLRDISHSQGPHSTSAVSNLEMSTSGRKILRTLRDISHSQGPHSTSAVSNLEISTSEEKVLRTVRMSSNSQGPHSTSSISSPEMPTSGEKILQTLREGRSSQNPHSVSTISSLEMSGSSEPNHSSYVIVSADSQQMDLSTQDTDKTKATDRHSQPPSPTTVTTRMSMESPHTREKCKTPFCSCSQTTEIDRHPKSNTGATEGTKQMNSRSNTESKISSSHLDSVTVSGDVSRDEETSKNVTQTFTTVNTSSSSRISSRPEKTEQMDLLHRDFVVTKEAFTFSQVPTEENGQPLSSSDMESIVSTFYPEDRSDRSEKGIIQTLGHTSSSYHPESKPTASQSEIPSSSALTDSSSVLNPVQTRQKYLSPGFTNVMEAESTYTWDSSQATDAEDSHLRSSSYKESIPNFQRHGVSVSSLTKTDEGSTLRTARDVSSFESDTQTSAIANATISSHSDFSHSFQMKTPEKIGPDLSPEDTDFTEGKLTSSQSPSKRTVEENGQSHSSSSSAEGVFSTYHLNSISISVLSGFDGERTLRTPRDVSNTHNVTQGSIAWHNETSSSLGLTGSSYLLTPVETDLTPQITDFAEGTSTHFQASSEKIGVGGSDSPSSSSNMETRFSHSDQDSASVSGSSGRDDEITLSTLREVNNVFNITQISSSKNDNITSSFSVADSSYTMTPKHTREMNSSSAGNNDFTEEALTYSEAPSETTDTESIPQSLSNFNIEKKATQTESMFSSTVIQDETFGSLTNQSRSIDTTELSRFDLKNATSSGIIQTSSATLQSRKENSPSTKMDFTLEQSSHTISSKAPSYSSSTKDFSRSTDHFQTIKGSEVGRRFSIASTDSLYLSTTFVHGAERTSRSLPDNSTSDDAADINPYNSQTSKSSGESLTLSSEPETERHNVSLSEAQSIGPSTEYSLKYPSGVPTTLSPNGSATISSTDNSTSGPRVLHFHTISTGSSATFSEDEQQTTQPTINTTVMEETESVSSYVENFDSTRSKPSSSKAFSRMTDLPLQDLDISPSSTEAFQILSSSTDSSSKNKLSDTGTEYQPRSGTDFGKQTSVSHTDSTYTLTTFAKGGERTLLSLPNNSTSSDSSESSTYSAEIPSTSESVQSFFSSEMNFSENSTEPLAVHSPKTPEYSSTPSESLETSVSMTEPEGTTGGELRTTGTSHGEYPTMAYPLVNHTILMTTGTSLLTEITEQPAHHSSSRTTSQEETKGWTLTLPGISIENEPITTTSSPYFQEMTTTSEPAKATTAIPLHTIPENDTFPSSTITMDKKAAEITHTPGKLPTSVSTVNYLFTTKLQKVPLPSPTEISSFPGIPTKMVEKSSTTTVKTTMPRIVVTPSPYILTSQKTTIQSFPASLIPSRPATTVNLESSKRSPTVYGKDIDECLPNPCPPMSKCTRVQGSFQCICSLGYQMGKGKCNLVRTFVGHFPLTFNTTGGTYRELHQIEGVIINLLNESLSTFPGYFTSTVKASRQEGTVQISILSTFSMASNVTFSEVIGTVQSRIRACKAPTLPCQLISNLTQLYRVGGLCKHKDPECDKGTSVCVDLDGIAVCQCKLGYFKYNKLDHSCRACEDGYKLENDTCVRCPFGLGGFNCRNPYQLITIVIAATGGGLLLIMGIALIVTCCQKNKNDISKLIFKSGDFQMSPYAEYPKNPRVQDWSRETIEMQENGSTKNLLQMTDVYYMPTNLRNPELERNGIYPPYTGLPGSRHSCIYPGQYNPSFISDDTRRRDYF
ncbi:protein HEG homolog 1-like isoform X2 [Erythrolamprus reginae]|uniref:protein HEG homolog 1-like isoform X2 n=1 Tax=Erythrolamprus reginae TaxID=121349 RepID=UPI00396CEC40